MHQYDVLPNISVDNYASHDLHANQYDWVEKNCYIDLYIELIHALQMEPLAMLPFTLAVDFAGDQWTFFKPQLSEIRDLYGVDIQELSMWRSLLEHCCEHLSADRLISVEVDAFWLPDTIATDYRRQHTKTTIAIVKLDLDKQRLGYFHNAGYYELADEDFRRIFRMDVPTPEDYLPPYAELIHIDNKLRHDQNTLIELSYALVHKYFHLRPLHNPITRFAERFSHELPVLQDRGLDYYHHWAFNNTRQLGAAFELAAANLQWLAQAGVGDFAQSIACFKKISADNKALILKIARAVNTKKALDLSAFYESMAADWEQGMQQLQNSLSVS